jgi:hypothetical protein
MTEDIAGRMIAGEGEGLEQRLAAAEAELGELREQVRQLSATRDIEEIRQLTVRYINAVALGEYEHITDDFADDIVLDLAKPNQPREGNPPLLLQGKENLRRFYNEVLSQGHTGQDGFFVVNPLITVDGDRAKATWFLYIMYRFPQTGQSLFWVQSLFLPEFVRQQGGWKFSAIRARERLGIPGGDLPIELVRTNV